MTTDLVERLRHHALPDPHDEREVLHAPLLREAADVLEIVGPKIAEMQLRYNRLEAQHGRLCDQVYEEDGETLKQTALQADNAKLRNPAVTESEWKKLATSQTTIIESLEADNARLRGNLQTERDARSLAHRQWLTACTERDGLRKAFEKPAAWISKSEFDRGIDYETVVKKHQYRDDDLSLFTKPEWL